ncbi:hypothetical protein J7400_18800 [Shimia sp. R9_2]|uniref:hypothetical protein n=1 Tax=Shimia sp. R9_2 TaxID=2821112 RepID=UPI001ADD01DB|nr:hypothetical protein [Shimia sp. R9_2]MBO9398727.1 hypothetical protein [Shimia sp. R9_2]
MARADFSDIDPGQTSGVDLADLLGDWADALISTHAGSARPTYAQPGTLWVKTGVPNNELMYFTGTVDLPLFRLTDSGAVATNAELVGGEAITKFLRTDIDSIAQGVVTFENSLRVGRDGGGASVAQFWNDGGKRWQNMFFSNVLLDWFLQDAAGTSRRIWHAGNHGAASGLDADLLDSLHAWQFLRRDIAANMLGRLSLEVPADEQLRIGHNTGAARSALISIFDGLVTQRGYLQARSDRLRLGHVGGAVLDLLGSGNARLDGHQIHHDGNQLEYVSPETTVGAGYTVTFNHGLGSRPRKIDLFLVCKTAHHGYGVGNEVRIPSGEAFSNWGAQAYTTNDTQIRVVYGAAGLAVLNAANGVRGTITGSDFGKWRLKVRAS